jgi:steroid delta-isomerase-like uncharacterized protein
MPNNNKIQYFENHSAGWNDHDPEKAMNQFAEGGTYFDPNVGTRISGREISEYVAGAIQGFPDLHFEEHRTITSEEGDKLVIASEWTMHGTHTGTLQGLPPTGNTLALEGVDIATVTAEGITSVTGYFDQKAFAEQLGLTFPRIIGQLPTLAIGAVKQVL